MGWLAWVLAVAACGGPPEGPADATGAGDPDLPKGIETQGTRLLGTMIDDLAGGGDYPHTKTSGWTADGTPTTVHVTGTAARESGARRARDPYFDGLVLPADVARLRITVHDGDANLARYRIAAALPPSLRWVDVCDDRPAIPMFGRWSATGDHIADPTAISFACEGSAAYKCVLWGYHPGTDPSSAAWRAHQACTRLVRADYCGNGNTHTFEGTTVTVYDRVGVHERPLPAYPVLTSWSPDATTFYHEATWNEHGALCISRLRWNAMPIGGLCTAEPPPCDDANLPGAEAGALLDNTSRYDDLPLQIWVGGTDVVSTMRGSNLDPPFPGYHLAGMDANDAIVLRTPPSDPLPPGLAELCMFDDGRDHVVDRCDQTELPARFTSKSHEGYVLTENPNPRRFATFWLVQRDDTGDFASTTRLGFATKNGYHEVATIGYLPPL